MLGVCLAAWLLLKLLPVLLVVVAALFLVGTLNPAVQRLEASGMGRGWAIGLVFLGLFTLASLLLGLTMPALFQQVAQLFGRERELRDALVAELSKHRVSAALSGSLRHWHHAPLAEVAARSALEYSTRFLEILGYIASFIFLALYIMVDRDRLRGAMFAAVPRAAHVRMSRIMLNLEIIVGGYIRGQVLTSVGMALFTFTLLMIVGVDDALAIAVFAGVIDVLPYIGVLLAITPAVAAASAQGLTVALTVLAAMIAYQEFESRILLPRIYGRSLRLPSSIILVALLAGGTLFGITGALLALPVAAAVLMLLEELRVQLPGEDVDDSELRKEDERLESEYERLVDGMPAHEAAAIAVELSRERQQDKPTL
ncbi:MAG: permease [Myxococcaceae bacterium]|nr:permease [Myxococcaceae bacterium]